MSDRSFYIKVNGDLFCRKQPKKQLAGNLSKILKLDKEKTAAWLLKNKIDPKQRAETLSVGNWINLADCFKDFLD